MMGTLFARPAERVVLRVWERVRAVRISILGFVRLGCATLSGLALAQGLAVVVEAMEVAHVVEEEEVGVDVVVEVEEPDVVVAEVEEEAVEEVEEVVEAVGEVDVLRIQHGISHLDSIISSINNLIFYFDTYVSIFLKQMGLQECLPGGRTANTHY